jgi:hypothetical protein
MLVHIPSAVSSRTSVFACSVRFSHRRGQTGTDRHRRTQTGTGDTKAEE